MPGPFAEQERARLEEFRRAAIEQRCDALIQLGRHLETLTDLQNLSRRHPLRERSRELLMVALHRSGRRTDALRVYEEGRQILAEELGVDPDAALRRCYELILRDNSAPSIPPAVAPPHQLPRALTGFVGRTNESVRLKSLLSPWDSAPPTPLVVGLRTAGRR